MGKLVNRESVEAAIAGVEPRSFAAPAIARPERSRNVRRVRSLFVIFKFADQYLGGDADV